MGRRLNEQKLDPVFWQMVGGSILYETRPERLDIVFQVCSIHLVTAEQGRITSQAVPVRWSDAKHAEESIG